MREKSAEALFLMESEQGGLPIISFMGLADSSLARMS
jgi:hypothetical protein